MYFCNSKLTQKVTSKFMHLNNSISTFLWILACMLISTGSYKMVKLVSHPTKICFLSLWWQVILHICSPLWVLLLVSTAQWSSMPTIHYLKSPPLNNPTFSCAMLKHNTLQYHVLVLNWGLMASHDHSFILQ